VWKVNLSNTGGNGFINQGGGFSFGYTDDDTFRDEGNVRIMVLVGDLNNDNLVNSLDQASGSNTALSLAGMADFAGQNHGVNKHYGESLTYDMSDASTSMSNNLTMFEKRRRIWWDIDGNGVISSADLARIYSNISRKVVV
jgi:hypothetical protein